MTDSQQATFRSSQIWTITPDEEYGFFLLERWGHITPVELWREMKTAIDNFYSTTTTEAIQEYNDRVDDKYQPESRPKRVKLPSKPGTVYLIHGAGTPWFKIGITTSLKSRIHQIEVSSPFPIVLIACYDITDTIADERKWHEKFSTKRTRGEWFALSENDVLDFMARNLQ